MAELKFLPETEPRNTIGDWTIRGCIAVFFFIFGMEKFASNPASHWVQLFNQIGAGTWFRYFTGLVEILGGLLTLISQTALAGLAILACTMASAVLILTFVIGRPADGIFPGVFFIALVIVGWRQRTK